MKKVFVIEDDADIGEVFHLVLKDHFRVKIFHSIDNALSEIERFKPDLLLIDHWLGELKLSELLTKLRTDILYEKIPVIISSTNDSVTKVIEKLQINTYLLKPFDVEELLFLMEKYLNNPVAKN